MECGSGAWELAFCCVVDVSERARNGMDVVSCWCVQ